MKTLGLIGGMSWESTALYYQIINETVRDRLGGLHSARLLLYSVDFHDIERLQQAGAWAEAGQQLAQAARALEVAGAEGLALCTNTMHQVAPAIEAAVAIPLWHIADPTAVAVQQAGVKTIGLLGTRFTMEQDFYRGRLAAQHGLTVRIPEAADRDLAHRIICKLILIPLLRREEFYMKHLVCLALLPGSLLLAGQAFATCPVLPADNIWNTPIDQLPLDARSSAYITSIGANTGLHPDFGSGTWDGGPMGIPYNLISSAQPKVSILFDYADESDPGPYPVPANPVLEYGSDHHLLIIDQDDCVLYETWDTSQEANGSWRAGSGAIFDLRSNALRPATWTSADAAGLPIFPGLARCEDIASGEIRHALRFTAARTQQKFVWPARHYASSITDPNVPPMGQRFRLKAAFDASGYSAQTRIILKALQTYGMFLADNGSNWYISGAPGTCWDDGALVTELRTVKGSDFEAVDQSSLIVNPDSGQVKTQTPTLAQIGVFRAGSWFLDANANGRWDGCQQDGGLDLCLYNRFGLTGDLPAVGNWDGSAKSAIGVLRSGTGEWFIDRNGNQQWDGCVADGCYAFGMTGDLPVAGDWNGTGFAKIGVFRNGQWYLDANGNGAWEGCGIELCLNFGMAGDLPVAGNWDGGTKAGVGVFRSGTWYLDYNANGVWDGCEQQGGQDKCLYNSFGTAGDLPVAGDWNGDGKAKVGVFRAGTWYLDYNGNGAWDGCGVDRCYVGSFGIKGDLPVAGRW